MIILESRRLLFRHHELADLEAYCAMEMNPDVRRFVGGYPRSRSDAENRFRSGLQHPSLDGLGVWAAILKPTGQYVGRSGLYPHFGPRRKTVSSEAALSFYVDRAFWNQGFASEAAETFVDFGWSTLNLSRIVATVQEGNSASTHILQKLGFSLVRTELGSRTFLHFALVNASQSDPNEAQTSQTW